VCGAAGFVLFIYVIAKCVHTNMSLTLTVFSTNQSDILSIGQSLVSDRTLIVHVSVRVGLRTAVGKVAVLGVSPTRTAAFPSPGQSYTAQHAHTHSHINQGLTVICLQTGRERERERGHKIYHLSHVPCPRNQSHPHTPCQP